MSAVVTTPLVCSQVARDALLNKLDGFASRLDSPCRAARLLSILGETSRPICDATVRLQRPDGGWADVEETTWVSSALHMDECHADAVIRAECWIDGQALDTGGWGLTKRGPARIVTTALVLALTPAARSGQAHVVWLASAWERDLEAEVQLAYKGALFLLGIGDWQGATSTVARLRELTVEHLCRQQNADGGFGPWKGHPIGSDPWSTGICLVGLCSHPDLADKRTIERAIKWLCDTQLPSGYWPYHFIDEGSAYAYWGLTEAIKFLEAH